MGKHETKARSQSVGVKESSRRSSWLAALSDKFVQCDVPARLDISPLPRRLVCRPAYRIQNHDAGIRMIQELFERHVSFAVSISLSLVAPNI